MPLHIDTSIPREKGPSIYKTLESYPEIHQMQLFFKLSYSSSRPSSDHCSESISAAMSGTKDWSYYPITGIPVRATREAQQGPNRKVPVRQNIDEWSSDPENEKQVKLFVMALDRFQKVDPSKRESYFQIAGELHATKACIRN